MLIIVEGCDNSGKTTFINNFLNKNTEYTYLHFNTPNSSFDFNTDYFKIFDIKNIILDRYFFSEIVYSKILNRQNRILPDIRTKLIETLKIHNALIVYIRPPLEIIEERFKIRGDKLINIENINKIIFEYDNLFNSVKTELNIVVL